jgi:hypothetical protein
MWDATRQEGYTLRWILPPGFSTRGPIVFLANLLKGESVLQIEDLLILYGNDLWSVKKFSERWVSLKTIWSKIPTEQPLLAVKPRIVTPTSLDNWPSTYDASLSWIIQSDSYKSPRWFWWDSVTPVNHKPFEPPPLKRSAEIPMLLSALCKPYLKLSLPDTYVLHTQEGQQIGIASIRSIEVSQSLRQIIKKESDGIPVEVEWNSEFNKYQIKSILPKDTPISVASFFPHATLGNGS